MNKTTLLATGLFCVLFAFPAAAGTWEQAADASWKYINDDGSYASGWITDNGKDYYLNQDGIMLADTTTPDGYYVDAAGAWDGQPAGSEAQSTAPAAPATVYQPGIYTVGVDIPAGEYVVFAQPNTILPYYEIRADNDFASYRDIIDSSLFTYNAIMMLEEGQFLQLDQCTASPVSEVTYIDPQLGNMFKVGCHVPAGTYTVRADGISATACYYIYSCPNDSLKGLISCNYVSGEAAVTVTDGVYLRLDGCNLVN